MVWPTIGKCKSELKIAEEKEKERTHKEGRSCATRNAGICAIGETVSKRMQLKNISKVYNFTIYDFII